MKDDYLEGIIGMNKKSFYAQQQFIVKNII